MCLNPFHSFLKTIVYALGGRIHFPKDCIGEALAMEEGQEFVNFRQVIVDPNQDQPAKPGATFRVRFHVAHMSAKQNKLFLLLPIPLFVGLPGFRSKLWMLNETNGDFQGVYEWDTVQDAEKYAVSFAMKFMTMRSVPGSVSYEIIPKQTNCTCQPTLRQMNPCTFMKQLQPWKGNLYWQLSEQELVIREYISWPGDWTINLVVCNNRARYDPVRDEFVTMVPENS